MSNAAPFTPVMMLLVMLPRLLVRVGSTGSVHAVYWIISVCEMIGGLEAVAHLGTDR